MSVYPGYCGSGSTPAQSTEFTEKKKILRQQLRDNSEKLKNAWGPMSEKHSIYNRLYSEITRAFSTFKLYSDALIYYEVFAGQNEVSAHVETMATTLNKLKERLDNARGIINDFIQTWQTHKRLIEASLKAVKSAESVYGLSAICIFNLDWLQTMPDPKVEQLATEWNELGIPSTLEQLIGQLEKDLFAKKNAECDLDSSQSSYGKRKRSD